ncbi:asparagine synthase [Candidatus Gottesmanbacteria bacterium]|nr:asparagine synthase [Candidatus Gottesmanbacteria bacterium]
MSTKITNIITKLDSLLTSSFSQIPKNKSVGILFSAGVDSSLIAKYAKDLKFKPELFTFGSDYSKDLELAKKLASDLVLPFNYLSLSEKEITKTAKKVVPLLHRLKIDPNLMQISLSIGFYAISRVAKEKGITLFLSGQGSDELFGGYNKYLKLEIRNLKLKMEQDTLNLFKVDIKRDRFMTRQSDIDIFFPYLDRAFIAYAQNLPLSLKIKGDKRKWILRQLAKQKGLPDYIYNRPKNALQYSSGIQKIVEKLVKKNQI